MTGSNPRGFAWVLLISILFWGIFLTAIFSGCSHQDTGYYAWRETGQTVHSIQFDQIPPGNLNHACGYTDGRVIDGCTWIDGDLAIIGFTRDWCDVYRDNMALLDHELHHVCGGRHE